MSGLTEQDLIDLDDWLASAPLRPLVDLLARIRARAVAETAERIAVAIGQIELTQDAGIMRVVKSGKQVRNDAARIAGAEAGR